LQHYTIEALSTGIARICCLDFGVSEVIVRVDKPSALFLAKAPGVEIKR
jgi:dihydroneopterin aldolase